MNSKLVIVPICKMIRSRSSDYFIKLFCPLMSYSKAVTGDLFKLISAYFDILIKCLAWVQNDRVNVKEPEVKKCEKIGGKIKRPNKTFSQKIKRPKIWAKKSKLYDFMPFIRLFCTFSFFDHTLRYTIFQSFYSQNNLAFWILTNIFWSFLPFYHIFLPPNFQLVRYQNQSSVSA